MCFLFRFRCKNKAEQPIPMVPLPQPVEVAPKAPNPRQAVPSHIPYYQPQRLGALPENQKDVITGLDTLHARGDSVFPNLNKAGYIMNTGQKRGHRKRVSMSFAEQVFDDGKAEEEIGQTLEDFLRGEPPTK